MITTKTAKESFNYTTQLIFPYDVNMHNTLMGGKLMYLMDIAAVISGMKHSGTRVVTVAVDSLHFKAPIFIGNILSIETQVTRAFRTSMEVKILVFREDLMKKEKIQTNNAYITVAAIDENMKPIPVPELIPETEEEKKEYRDAEQRRAYRLSQLKDDK